MFPIGKHLQIAWKMSASHSFDHFQGFFMVQKTPRAGAASHQNLALPMENEHHHFWGKLFPHHILHHPVLSDKGYSNIHQKNLSGIRSKDWPLKPQKLWDSNPWRLGLDDYPLMESMGFQWDTLGTIWNYNIFHLGNRKIMENSSSKYISPGEYVSFQEDTLR